MLIGLRGLLRLRGGLLLRWLEDAGDGAGWQVFAITHGGPLHSDVAMALVAVACLRLLRCRLLLALVITLHFSLALMIRNHLDVRVPLHRLLDWGRRGLDRAGSARVRDRAADVGEEAENVSHAMLHLGVLEAVASHCHELLWPQVRQIGYFAGGHQNAAGESQAFVLKELMHLEAALQEHISIVTEDGWLALEVDGLQGLLLLVLDLICAKDDTLAVEVRQDVVGANKLHAPVKTV